MAGAVTRDSRGRFGRRAAQEFRIHDGTSYLPRYAWKCTVDGKWIRPLDPITGKPSGPWERTR